MKASPENFKRDAALLERYLLSDRSEVHASVQVYFEDPCFSQVMRPQELGLDDEPHQGIK